MDEQSKYDTKYKLINDDTLQFSSLSKLKYIMLKNSSMIMTNISTK